MPDIEGMEELDLGMTNFDHSIEEGFAEALRARPGAVFGRHAGWNFNGKVHFSDGKFHEEVWVYGTPSATISADTLPELMTLVNDQFGYE